MKKSIFLTIIIFLFTIGLLAQTTVQKIIESGNNVYELKSDGSIIAASIAGDSYTVANLPASPDTGAIAYSSNVLTPYGTGGVVFYDGSTWRLVHSYIEAKADLNDYLMAAYAIAYISTTPLTTARLYERGLENVYGPDINSKYWTTGSGASTAAYYSESPYKWNALQLETGTTTTGEGSRGGYYLSLLANTHMQGFKLKVMALCDATEKYYVNFGIMANPWDHATDGTWFAYDMYQEEHSSSATNNWLCVTSNSGSQTETDSGVAVAVEEVDLVIIEDSSSAVFYIDGTAVATNTSNLDAGIRMADAMHIQKTAGTTEREVHVYYTYSHIRWDSSKAFE